MDQQKCRLNGVNFKASFKRVIIFIIDIFIIRITFITLRNTADLYPNLLKIKKKLRTKKVKVLTPTIYGSSPDLVSAFFIIYSINHMMLLEVTTSEITWPISLPSRLSS